MKKTAYRIGEGANLQAFPHGTQVGDVVKLTPAQALYELDMGRIEVAEEKKAEETGGTGEPPAEAPTSDAPDVLEIQGTVKTGPADGKTTKAR